MVDWDRVEELRSKDWDWDQIADDPKVGFHPDKSVQEPGRALRGLYHRQRSRQRRRNEEPSAAAPSKQDVEKAERKWTLPRIGYLLVPVFAIWFTIAYLVPSPVGLVLPAIPYLALALVVAAFLLLFGLFRSEKARWSKPYRTALVTGVVLGLVISGVIALGGILFFGCPILPSSGTSHPDGWMTVSASAWQDGGRPVIFFYGATWCPYCSASSWAIWKALLEFGQATGASTSYSASGDVYPSTPEVVLAGISFSSSTISFQVAEDTSGNDGTFPATANCVQQAYFTAYAPMGTIPFVAINGQYIHGGTTLIGPSNLQTWAGGQNGGASSVMNQVSTESGTAWNAVQDQAWWVMAYLTKSCGESVAALTAEYHWSAATQAGVSSRLSQVS